MSGKLIVCPYCFAKFKDEEVHFRMETVFEKEEDCDPDGLGRPLIDIEETGNRALLEAFKAKYCFLAKKDERYEKFWSVFGATTERASLSKDGKNAVAPYLRLVLDPRSMEHGRFFRGKAEENEDGLVVSVTDCFGKKTDRRVCPQCHNPLPGTYGKNQTKFISVVGITGAGKTVYLSQLCKHFKAFAANLGITSIPTSKGAMEFILSHPVAMGEPLPEGSPPEALTQPIFYDLNLRNGSKVVTNTVVFYDIAGENCVDHEKMKHFGPFVEQSDGIMLLIDPVQLGGGGLYDGTAGPTAVLEAIYNRFANKKQEDIRSMPLAVCISKGDTAALQITGRNMEEVQHVQDGQKHFLPVFNADSYNSLQSMLKGFVDDNEAELRTHLINLFDNYNYFLFSAIGASTHKIVSGGEEKEVPAAPPIPKRIQEPLFWLFHKFGYIGVNAEINSPEQPCQDRGDCGGEHVTLRKRMSLIFRKERGAQP
ncbi:MAG: hypothetical protein FWG42_05485 [Clostridiales bacterium]|nr:hypothetical protein [Clostridiales bacterium]